MKIISENGFIGFSIPINIHNSVFDLSSQAFNPNYNFIFSNIGLSFVRDTWRTQNFSRLWSLQLSHEVCLVTSQLWVFVFRFYPLFVEFFRSLMSLLIGFSVNFHPLFFNSFLSLRVLLFLDPSLNCFELDSDPKLFELFKSKKKYSFVIFNSSYNYFLLILFTSETQCDVIEF